RPRGRLIRPGHPPGGHLDVRGGTVTDFSTPGGPLPSRAPACYLARSPRPFPVRGPKPVPARRAMPMTPPSQVASAADLLAHLSALALLEDAQLAVLASAASRCGADARTLAGELVRRGWLTPFQANQLLQGRGRDLVLGQYV